ncbi:hypothetical protein CNR22_19395 [Sphingobacteriaceae bacterium]|nr:hypothetical protein CNR22_19395 [Sphingobacteriaceae bacterium]
MKSICLFASYFPSEEIPYYVTVYLKELKKQFGEVLLLVAKEKLAASGYEFLKKEGIQVDLQKENKGFDFGLWYNAFQTLDLDAYDEIALVNDSSVLFKSLDGFTKWSRSNGSDLKGITYSDAIYPHIQSYFLVLNRAAVKLTADYFQKHKVLNTISEVISTYEVGLSKYLQEGGLKIAAFIDNNGYSGEFSPYYHCIDYHIYKGVPMIKKKIMFASYRKTELFTLARMNFNIDRNYYLDLIKRTSPDLIIDLDKLKDQKEEMNLLDKLKYQSSRTLIRMYKLIKKNR